ncbi:MAG: hypothetical protein ACKERG_03940 [Candidatus Hodgkinia cicadicola]
METWTCASAATWAAGLVFRKKGDQIQGFNQRGAETACGGRRKPLRWRCSLLTAEQDCSATEIWKCLHCWR